MLGQSRVERILENSLGSSPADNPVPGHLLPIPQKTDLENNCSLFDLSLSLYLQDSILTTYHDEITRMLVKDFDRGFDSKFEASSHQLHCLYYEIDDESIVDVLHICGSMFLLPFCKKSGEASKFRVELLVFTF